jgi:hypothetical protein
MKTEWLPMITGKVTIKVILDDGDIGTTHTDCCLGPFTRIYRMPRKSFKDVLNDLI